MRSKEDIKKYQKEYRNSHKRDRKIYDQLRYDQNKEFFKDKNAEYHLENKDSRHEYKKNYYAENKDIIRVKRREYIRYRRQNDEIFNLRGHVSKNVARALKTNGASKNGHSVIEFLPYSIDLLKVHLEKQFEPWMTWENWGIYNSKVWNDNDPITWTWQIDHIIPQSTLPYSSMNDDNFKRCWALENLRPLSSKANVLKRDKIGDL